MAEYEKTAWGRSVPYTSPVTGRSTTLYNIGVVAEAVGRTSATIRKWEVGGIIPPTPFKMNGRRMYSKEHIDAIVHCAEISGIKQGSKTTQSKFTRHMYKEFPKVNALFFKEEKSDGSEEE